MSQETKSSIENSNLIDINGLNVFWNGVKDYIQKQMIEIVELKQTVQEQTKTIADLEAKLNAITVIVTDNN